MTESISVLFVCLGNICRSPMAEAVFVHTVKEKKLQHKFSQIDSAGTAAYHGNNLIVAVLLVVGLIMFL
ncbi:unnamed protein product [Rhizopus stolonifer]